MLILDRVIDFSDITKEDGNDYFPMKCFASIMMRSYTGSES